MTSENEEVPLQLDNGKTNDVPPSRDKVMMNALTQMNENLNTIGGITEAATSVEFGQSSTCQKS